jgi:tetratricopeptide (TPR) repeat protein
MATDLKREIRVFISSTFRDMQKDRDYLVKFIFPQLRKLCEQRGVNWHEVDLRWGITDEQSSEGQVLPICLKEIQNCRPYFIGILGERYGWIPEQIKEDLIEQEPWIRNYAGHSVTELEILHGVLNDPLMTDHALFYFRDPEYLKTINQSAIGDFTETPWAEDIEKFGMNEALKRTENRKHKLGQLKQQIRNSGFPLKENYKNVEQLGEWLLEDMRKVIDSLFPEGSEPSVYEREIMEHEAFAFTRAKLYIGGQKYCEVMDEYVRRGGNPLVVTGESGLGKSALLANWVMQHRNENPEDVVIMHFIGASADSVNWENTVRRIITELKIRLDIPGDIPETADQLKADFPVWLALAGMKGRVILVIDGLNQLENVPGALELTWFPEKLPENIRVISSTLPGRSLDVLKQRGSQFLIIEPLNRDERAQLVKQYLTQFSKQLDSVRLERIVSNPKFANPLALRILLDELRQFGVYEHLDVFIDRYMKADSILEMFNLKLERCENDFEQVRPGLVKDALSFIWAGRRGLIEADLLNLLGDGDNPLPSRIWSPLYLAMEESFVNRSGELDFFHDYLRLAVEKRYLADKQTKVIKHGTLANYFENLEGYPYRKIKELPWQISKTENWERLSILFKEWFFFVIAFQQNHLTIQKYWAQIEENSDIRMTEAYEAITENENYDVHFVSSVRDLLSSTYHFNEAEKLSDFLLKKQRGEINPVDLATSLNARGVSLKNTGSLDEALQLFSEAEQILRNLGTENGFLATVLGNAANVLRRKGDFEKALDALREAEVISRELNNKYAISLTLNGLAITYIEMDRAEEALACLKDLEAICRETGDEMGLAVALGNKATALEMLWKAEPDEFVSIHREEAALYRAIGVQPKYELALSRQVKYLQRLARTIYKQALSSRDKQDFLKLQDLYKEEEQIWQLLKQPEKKLVSQINQVIAMAGSGKKEALNLLNEIELEAQSKSIPSILQQCTFARQKIEELID